MSRVGPLARRVGVYEKSLPDACGDAWDPLFRLAVDSGYGFFELSIDESTERLARLDWAAGERTLVKEASRRAGLPIGTICLSAHRAYPMGSAETNVRSRSLALARKAVELAADLEAPLVQLAGYFTYYEPRHQHSRAYFLDGLAATAELARKSGVRLAIENVDGSDVTTVEQAASLVRDSSTGDVAGLYVDVGNSVGNGQDPIAELGVAWPLIEAIQLKDARPGEYRRIPFGEGLVPWRRLFAFLDHKRYAGPLSVEMWNDEGDPDLALDALHWLRGEGMAS